MPFRKTLAQRLFNAIYLSSHSPHPSLSYLSSEPSLFPPDPAKTLFHRDFRRGSGTDRDGFLRRLLHKGAMVASSMATKERWSLSLDNRLTEKLKGLKSSNDRLRLDELNPPVTRSDILFQISVDDTRKLLRLSRLETLKTKLRRIPKKTISYPEFVQICSDGCLSHDQALESAKILDESGAVIVLGNIVFLQPDQVTEELEAIISRSMEHSNDLRRKELEAMEKEKTAIDRQADALVRKELWTGMGFLIIQTLAFMRLTFWELNWDVMEPICFYVTSIYFMAGFAFYMRTSKDPSFQGFYESRFNVKQKRLMKNKNFDIERFGELRRSCSTLWSN